MILQSSTLTSFSLATVLVLHKYIQEATCFSVSVQYTILRGPRIGRNYEFELKESNLFCRQNTGRNYEFELKESNVFCRQNTDCDVTPRMTAEIMLLNFNAY
jgi:hypothetical protein